MFLDFFKFDKPKPKFKVIVIKLREDSKLQVNDEIIDLSGNSDMIFISEEQDSSDFGIFGKGFVNPYGTDEDEEFTVYYDDDDDPTTYSDNDEEDFLEDF